MSGYDYYKKALDQFGDFKGRARRSEFWYFHLFSTLILFYYNYLPYFLLSQ
jgi:uncharacterized membrane protein YhaH (DUF805 family)